VLFAPAKEAFGHRLARLRDAVALVPRGASKLAEKGTR
jgi:hypothetical protein